MLQQLKLRVLSRLVDLAGAPVKLPGFQRRMLFIGNIHIDTNLINSRQTLDTVNQLERWAEDEVILMVMSSTARDEALAGGDPLRTRKTNTHIFTCSEPISDQSPEFHEVAQALFPGATLTSGQRNDVRLVCEARKYAAILVTNDGASKSQPGGILGNRGKIQGLKILSPDEAVAFVRQQIVERDDWNRKYQQHYGGELPDWTGKD